MRAAHSTEGLGMASLVELVRRLWRGPGQRLGESASPTRPPVEDAPVTLVQVPPESEQAAVARTSPTGRLAARAQRSGLLETDAPPAPADAMLDLEALLRRQPRLDLVRSRRSQDPESRANDGYQLLEALRDKVGGMLLLTATPMQLHDFELYSMIELVEPGLFNGYGDFAAARAEIAAINRAVTALRSEHPNGDALDDARELLDRYGAPPELPAALNGHRPDRLVAAEWLSRCHRLSRALVRNRKTEIGGFTSRVAHRIEVTPGEAELKLQSDLLQYIRGRYAAATSNKRTAVGLVLVAFQKMLCSSTNALAGSLESRRQRLQNELADETPAASSDDPELIEEEQRILALPAEDLADEVDILGSLARRARRIEDAKVLALESLVGLSLLPSPSPEDLFLDLEGDPFWQADRKLEYLFGLLWQEGDDIGYRSFWAHDPGEERRAFEDVIDFITERLAGDPQLHVYHYASYEPATFKRLAAAYGTREDAVDDLLRREILVDLYAVVRQALRAGLSSYSLKQLEDFLPLVRTARIKGGDDATVAYEAWRESGDNEYLQGIEAYNREDCIATLQLRDWLVGLRDESGVTHWRQPPELQQPSAEGLEALEEREELRRDLLEGASEEDERWLVAHLLEYHCREAKPEWWAFFARLEMTSLELVEDADSIGELEHLAATSLPPPRRSIAHSFTYPAQEHKLAPGDEVVDPVTGLSAGVILSIDDEHGRLELVRGPGLAEVEPPRALIPAGPWHDTIQRKALMRLAFSMRADDGRYPVLRGVLRRELPRIRGHSGVIQTAVLQEMTELLTALDESHLFIQGPPGSGKTWTGARLIVSLIEQGWRVGVASTSHKAIHNLLDEIEVAAKSRGVRFWGLKKSTPGNDESVYESRHIKSADGIASFAVPSVNLVAGTAWLFTREELEDAPVDYLFIDEAGQVSLADALAMGTCARNLILLGDPLQLAQVTQGTHPLGTGISVLEHLLGEAETIPPERGIFLEETFRMHPDITGFVSEIVYEGRLRSAASCERQRTAYGTGLRYVSVEHQGNRRRSVEEAEAVATEIARMVGGDYRLADGTSRPLEHSDFVVVTPYNEQVRCLREFLPEGVRIGTVDKFQGQEAAVVFFSMATSSGADTPRNLEFLFSRNRLNVAISRARCLAI